MWDMCQMLNIWHISHTKPNLSPFSRCGIWYFLCNIEQYCDKFATVRKRCGILFIVCLFLFLSHFSVSLTSLTPILNALSHPRWWSFPRRRRRRSLSSNGFSFFFFFFWCCGLMGSVPMEVGGFGWARLWVENVGVGRRWRWRRWR